ncbi:M20 family metallopeptidase [Siccirubricoccus sp. KC 17139]|uniref:M20 family metallopeptidase n=1 Tax=Siccirubricoccus soli TaxID=2899147 RepID=A0ABT1DBT5_9PROT|nr:M20 family metallopeptidase [Siccirubricoccus soli]MCO6419394.1 M20 family metallopeptidase [Siccirubricoccus soli]MCP2685529.1 M20 family metallopeptidase [Siccirubricoccus soli]
MGTRESAIERAREFFDDGRFRSLLADLVAIPSTAQDPAYEAELVRYLETAIRPWVERLGFTATIHPNPLAGFGPILTAERIEDPGRPTVLLYGHGDTVRGLDEQWRQGLTPWALTEEGDHWYGRGTADNKGQHALNLAALEAVLAERGGRLGFNVKLVLEMAEERGSRGLREFVAANRALLAADVLIASDGPRVDPELPTIATGTRGIYQFDLVLKLREGGVHSGHWGGLTTDPAIRLTHAIASICDARGKILVRDWLPRNGVPAEVRGVLAGCPVGGAEGAATIDPDWGEPGLTPAEKIYGWNSFIVLAMVSGRPEAPVNAVAPDARATCHIRYTVDTDPAGFGPALRRHLDEHGFADIEIREPGVRMAASRTPPDHPWVRWAQASMQRSLGKRVQIIPNSSGGLPGDVFMDHLGTPLVWVPHSYNGCKQHGPDEHLLTGPAREGILAFAGLWWDLGEAGTPG